MKDSMRKHALLAIVLLVAGALFVPAVSAEPVVLTDTDNQYLSYSFPGGPWQFYDHDGFRISMWQAEKFTSLKVLYVKTPALLENLSDWEACEGRDYPVEFVSEKTGNNVGYGTIAFNILRNSQGAVTSIQWWVEPESWDLDGLQGLNYIQVNYAENSPLRSLSGKISAATVGITAVNPMIFYSGGNGVSGEYILRDEYEWETTIDYDESFVYVTRNNQFSTVSLQSAGINIVDSGYDDDKYIHHLPTVWNITNGRGIIYNGTFTLSSDPGEESPVLRKGSVTMTDNNGTTITGFNVTAVNRDTGQEYTVSTETDVAVMTLPMDRTIRLRNPQTGEYEDAPVGYYRFYGQAPGYKMLSEDGIQVSVVPEKYTSYELCIILVTPESGYLTGQHQFQIRSRADNSILQTGTISAESATTGDWYNTTVSGGIATLILPYDTSNSISQYAGNYAVYATSPGYEDSEYGTQIVVMPHTASDIRDIHLTPIGGVPTPGNVTLRIQVFSETGPGVVNADIFIAGIDGAGESVWDTYTASSTGYLAVSVPGNSTYNIVASGAGYYDSARLVEVLSEDPPLIEIKLYLTGAPTLEPTTQPTGWPTEQPTGQPTGGIPDEDDDSEGFLMQAVRGIGLAFGVGFATAKMIFGMLLALSIGYATAKQLRGGAAEFGLGLLGGTLLGVLIGLLPVWIIVVLLLVVGLYIGNRYVGGGANNG